jgi:hypothetical protein
MREAVCQQWLPFGLAQNKSTTGETGKVTTVCNSPQNSAFPTFFAPLSVTTQKFLCPSPAFQHGDYHVPRLPAQSAVRGAAQAAPVEDVLAKRPAAQGQTRAGPHIQHGIA